MPNRNDQRAKGPSTWQKSLPHSNPNLGLRVLTEQVRNFQGSPGLQAAGNAGTPSPLSLAPSRWPPTPQRQNPTEGTLSTPPPSHTRTHTIPGLLPPDSGRHAQEPAQIQPHTTPRRMMSQLRGFFYLIYYVKFGLLAQKISRHLKITTPLLCH